MRYIKQGYHNDWSGKWGFAYSHYEVVIVSTTGRRKYYFKKRQAAYNFANRIKKRGYRNLKDVFVNYLAN